jgi:UDP-N-acetylglucosamine 2-epimerase (non-hydrolysing)
MSPRPTRPVAVVFGTRPEAIKLAPVILRLRERGVPPLVVITGQHRELVDDVLDRFEIGIDQDLDLMLPKQSLDHVLSHSLEGIGRILDEHQPAAVVVQGDTTSTLGASLAAFHRHVPVAHVEAGLRSRSLDFPYPEEMNRRVVSMVARWHFAPTIQSAENLRAEGVEAGVHVTGNTVVDALDILNRKSLELPARLAHFLDRQRFVLATGHRRESWGDGIRNVATALSEVLRAEPDLRLVFVTHPNPEARRPVTEALGEDPRACILDALDYPGDIGLMRRAELVVSDSGGVQEEGPTLGVPILVTRGLTERPEGVDAGAVRLVGTDREAVRAATLELLRNADLRQQMSEAGRGLYGDGHAAERIAEVLIDEVWS